MYITDTLDTTELQQPGTSTVNEASKDNSAILPTVDEGVVINDSEVMQESSPSTTTTVNTQSGVDMDIGGESNVVATTSIAPINMPPITG